MLNKSFRLGIVIQARTGSTRLPQKIILDFDAGISILDIILDKLNDSFAGRVPIVLATSDNKADDCLEGYALKRSIYFFQGNEQDVLLRFINVAEKYNLSHIVRVCADNPLINIEAIKDLIAVFENEFDNGNDIDYLSYKNGMNTPVIRTHLGLFTEIVSLRSLKRTFSLACENVFHEHVTNYIYSHEKDFNVMLLPAVNSVLNRYDIRLTIDDPDDFNTVSKIYNNIKGHEDNIDYIISFLDRNDNYLRTMNDNINKYIK